MPKKQKVANNSMRLVYPIMIVVLSLVILFLIWQSLGRGWFSPREEKVVSNHNIVTAKNENNWAIIELVKYRFKDIMEHKIEYDWWPDSKAILIISGEAIGCMDLRKIKADDITNLGDTLVIRLPEPEICNYKINHNESRIYDTQTFSFDESRLLDRAFKEAEKQVRRTRRAIQHPGASPGQR
ncbi:MAG: DUF4230 domain-containing protein [Bacteroidia bacterium]|nr:DUF4230 domain-containing protein [Bacteroidia bacterium]